MNIFIMKSAAKVNLQGPSVLEDRGWGQFWSQENFNLAPTCSQYLQLWATVLNENLTVLSSLDILLWLLQSNKHYLTEPPLINGIPYLANERTTQKLTLVKASPSSIFMREFCYVMLHFKVSNFSDSCFPVNWEYCNECL